MMLRNFVDIALFAMPIFVLYVKNIVSFLLLTSIYHSNQPWKFNHVYFAYFEMNHGRNVFAFRFLIYIKKSDLEI